MKLVKFALSLCRVRVGKAATEREFNPNRKSALEISVREFVERKEGVVVNPTVGKSFDSLDEAYEFYNLYSWESGFGVRFAKSRLNVHRMKCMQEIVCACAVRFTPWQINNIIHLLLVAKKKLGLIS